jgi:hypothetical protein
MKLIRPNICPLLALLAASCATAPAPAGEPLPFHFYKELQREAPADEEIVRVTLDGDVYAATEDRFPDLRVLDPQGAEVPFRLEKATASRSEKVRKPCPSKVLSLQENDDGSIAVTLKLDDLAPAADGLSILTPLADYERHVSVLGSADGSDWKPLVTDGRVFDYSRYMDVSNREVELPKNRHRQFKVVIDDVTDQQQSPLMQLTRELRGDEETRRTESTTVRRRPFRIDRIECWSEDARRQVQGDKKMTYPVVDFQTEEDAKEKSTVIGLRTRREPITSLVLKTASRNFSRQVSVQVPVVRGVLTEWVDVGQATLSNIHVGNFQRERLEVTFPEQRQEEYRIVVSNGDSPPLDVTGIEAEGNIYQIVFFAPGPDPMRVYYGSQSAEQPNYDTTAALASLESGYPAAEGRLGVEVANPAFGERPGTALGRLLNNKFFLTGAICLVVAVLAWTLFRAGRRIDEIPDR